MSVQIDNTPTCEKCGGSMILRKGKYGQFYGCSSFPKCRNTKPYNGQSKEEPKKAFEPSKYQRAVFEFVKAGKGHGVVKAAAGSGKTTTIVQALQFTDDSADVAFVAFNRLIANTLKDKAPQHVHVSTLHSLGFGNIRNALGKVKVEPKKVYYIIRNLQDFMSFEEKEIVDQSISSIIRFVSLCKSTLREPTTDNLDWIADRWNIETNGDRDLIFSVTAQAYQRSVADTNSIDYDDMIFLCATGKVPCQQFDVLFVDETQDLNKAQLEMAVKSIKPNGRILAVGDENQSIYGFRGADTQAMPNIIERLNATVMPLSITYRCPKSHVELAQTLVPEIEAAEWAKDGIIENISQYDFMDRVKPGDLVLCRCNAPLVSPAFSLIRQGVKAVILGRDIGTGLVALIKKIQKRHRVTSLNDTLSAMTEYSYHEIAKLNDAKKEMQAQALEDKVETIFALSDGCQTVFELERKIQDVFSDESEGVTFSSVHKAKGAESDRVFILKPDLMPHPKATSDWEQEQEWNIMYVAYTRSKSELYFVGGQAPFVTPEPEKEMEKKPTENPDILSQFPVKGRLEDIVRYSAQDFVAEFEGWTPSIEKGQLALTKQVAGDVSIIILTGVKPGEIAGPKGEDSIRVVLREGDTFRKGNERWTTRSYPADMGYFDAVKHVAKKTQDKVDELSADVRGCDCEGAQVRLTSKSEKSRGKKFWKCRECEKFEWA